jgi:hypothetical protein
MPRETGGPNRSFDILQVNFRRRLKIFESATRARALGADMALRRPRRDQRYEQTLIHFVKQGESCGVVGYAEAFRKASLSSWSAVEEACRI